MITLHRLALLVIPLSLASIVATSCASLPSTTDLDGDTPPNAGNATVAETCLAFSEAATEEANAAAHYQLGTIQIDEYSARLEKAKSMYGSVPTDAETELGVAITEFRQFLAEPSSDGLPFDVANNEFGRLRSGIGMICDLAGETINIYMEPGTGG